MIRQGQIDIPSSCFLRIMVAESSLARWNSEPDISFLLFCVAEKTLVTSRLQT